MKLADACESCLSRSLLIGLLGGYLESAHVPGGQIDQLFALDDETLLEALNAPPEFLKGAQSTQRIKALQKHCEKLSIATVCRHSSSYPEALTPFAGSPATLFIAGAEQQANELLSEVAVAVVGSRRCSGYGRDVGQMLGRDLSAAGVIAVSGMALGVDSAVHEGALSSGGRTVAVLACGVDVPYPASKSALHRKLVGEAVVVSELPPGTKARRWAFPARNRIIAGLAELTVVVEAMERSGSLITAAIARDIGREVGAVPGQVTSPKSGGTNSLIHDGAHMIRGCQDILDVVFDVGTADLTRVKPDPQTRLVESLDRSLQAIYELVAGGAGTTAELVALGVAPEECLRGLAELELLGLIQLGGSGRYRPTV